MRRAREQPTDVSARPVRLLDWLTYALLGVFLLVTLGPALLGRGALIDLNLLTKALPFRALSGVDTARTIVCRGDTVDFYLPGIAAIKRGLLAGDFVTWAPYEVGGTPLAALPNHAALSPFSLPYYLLPLWLAPAFVTLGEFAAGIGGMFLFLRRLGVGRGPSVLAGILFVASGFMSMWSNWPHVKVAALIPLLFWALERTVQQRRARDVVLVGAVVAGMLLGGFPAVALFALTLAGAYVVVRAVTRFGADLRAVVGVLARATAGVVLGVGLSAIQIVPFVRSLDVLGLDERQADGQHLPTGLFLTSVAPDAVGQCVGGERYGSVIPIEAVGFLGAVAMVLAVCAVAVRRPRGSAPDRSPRVFLAAAAAFTIVVVWVGGPLLAALQMLPFYSSNGIGRAQVVFCFVGAALAGIGLDRLLRHLQDHERPRPPGEPGPGPETRDGDAPVETAGRSRLLSRSAGLLAAVVAAGFACWVVVRAFADARADDYTDHLLVAVRVPALLLLAALVAVLLTRFGPARFRVVGPVVLVVLAVGQSTFFAHTMLPRSDPANLYPLTPTHAFLRDHIGGDRYAASGRTMYPATSDYYELRTPVGHEFTDPRWKDLLLAADPEVELTRTFSTFSAGMTVTEAARSPLLDQLSVRYWVATPSQVLGSPDRRRPQSGPPERVPLDPGERATCEIPGGPLRGVSVYVARGRPVPVTSPAVLHVSVRTPTGVLEGSQLLGPALRRGPVRVAVVGEDLRGRGSYPVKVWVTGVHGRTVLRGADGQVGCSAVRPDDDRMRLVFADTGGTVYERLGALPRIRWAARSRVVEDPDQRLTTLAGGTPDDLVLLDDGSTPAAAGEPAQVDVVSDEAERIEADVDAGGRGYLVVADALLRDGWTASVDGTETPIVAGNHAFAAVPVPSGRHRVVLSYTAPGLRAGVAVTAASAVVALGLLAVPPLLGWRRRTSAGARRAIP